MSNRISIEDFEKISKKAMDEALEETLSEFNKICKTGIAICGIIVVLGIIMLFIVCNMGLKPSASAETFRSILFR
jgi:hypothetical protein